MRWLASLGPLIGMWIVIALTLVAHAALNVPISALEWLVISYAPAVFVLLWMVDDAYQRHCTPCYDFGFLMWCLFPVSALGYLVWTRGWRGILVFFLLLALMYAPWVVINVLWFLAT